MDAQDDTTEAQELRFLCTKCGVEKPASAFYKRTDCPSGYRHICKACTRASVKARYYTDLAESHRRAIISRAKHRDENKARSAAWREEHPDRARQLNQRWKAQHPTKMAGYRRKRYLKHGPRIRTQNAGWWAANPDKSQEYCRKRRARKANAPAIGQYTRREIAQRDRWICQLCYGKVDKSLKFPHPGSMSLDHVIPLGKGGPDTKQNVVLVHFGCNSSKRDGNVPQQQRLF